MNNEKILTMDDFKKKVKAKKCWDSIKAIPGKTLDWTGKHYAELCVGVPLVVGSVCKVSNLINMNLRNRRDYVNKNLMYYDPSAHVWYELKRKMTNAEKTLLGERIKNGEKRIDILQSLKILK